MLFILSVLARICTERRFWKLTRSGQWFEIVDTAFTEKEWYDNFRVSNSTFELQHVNLVILKNPYLVAPPLVTFYKFWNILIKSLNFHKLKLWRIKVIKTFTTKIECKCEKNNHKHQWLI